MDFAITIDEKGRAGMTFNRAGDIFNNVFLSLTVRRGSFFQDPDFGSRLHLLAREKNTPRTERLAVEYVKEALQWLLDTGRARSITVDTQREMNRLKLRVEVVQANGQPVTYDHFVEVV